MNSIRENLTRLALIADPAPEHFALLREILYRSFSVESRWVNTFEELSQHEARQNQLEYILIAENLPLSPSRPNAIPRRYFMKLWPKWGKQLLFIVSQKQSPDLIGLPHEPNQLLLKADASLATTSLIEQKKIEAVFRQLNQERRLHIPPRARRTRLSPVFDLQGKIARGPLSQLTDSQILLAAIKRTNQSIAEDWNRIEQIKLEKRENLQLLKQAMEHP